MVDNRRTFFKNVAIGIIGLQTLRSNVLAASEPIKGPVDIDKSLHFLEREKTTLPLNSSGYYSSFYKRVFIPIAMEPSLEKAIFKACKFPFQNGEELEFVMKIIGNKVFFSSLDQRYSFFWKRGFGLYATHPHDHKRIVELCPPQDSGVSFLPNVSVEIPQSSSDETNCSELRRAGHQVTGYHSPLSGFAGFCEESLYADSKNTSEIITRQFDIFFQKIPVIGLTGLKKLARTFPSAAEAFVQRAIPRVIGWIIGPSSNLGMGKILVHDCPFRKRLGTLACESVCGSAIGNYFTNEVKIPMRFDPSTSNYSKCTILIGKKA